MTQKKKKKVVKNCVPRLIDVSTIPQKSYFIQIKIPYITK